MRRHLATRGWLPVFAASAVAIGCVACASDEQTTVTVRSSNSYYGEASYDDGVTDTRAAIPAVDLPTASGASLTVHATAEAPPTPRFASRYLRHGNGSRIQPADHHATIRFAISNWNGSHFSHNTWADPGATPVRVGRSTPTDVLARVYTLVVGDIVEFTDRAGPELSRSGPTQVVVLEVVSRG
ncbi:hypothetical protein SAMN05443575_1558 [Jatrophihabitans endophyticus]|uniref:Uncharacterized protein n=1 Tax=Jatrophihabitans endophyticus TaxID=1206085 RepID=A0A1M5HLB3_9ACTN|nr:hypothetical protein [Jatrophihabitans endophyticus]SHG16739.1 hypothetical protein SAMN05443575_1558 [Jatrophihabitans endophyticus]